MSDYRFFPNNRFDRKALQETYQDFARNGLRFWTDINYDVPLATSFPVLAVLFLIDSVIQGVLSAKYNFTSLFQAQIGILFLLIVLFGFILLMKEWLEARGGFKQYLCFSVYAFFIVLPISVVSGLSTQLGVLIKFCLWSWIIYAFYKTFQIVGSRFLILVGIVWGIAILAFISTLIAGLKLFI